MHIGLKLKLVIPLIIIVALTLFISIGTVVKETESTLIAAGRERVLHSATIVGNSMAAQINRAKTDIRFAVNIPSFIYILNSNDLKWHKSREDFVKYVNALLQRIVSFSNDYDSFFVVNDQGLIISSSESSDVNQVNVSKEVWFQEVMKGEQVVLSLPFRKVKNGSPLVAVAGRLKHEAGFNGAIVGFINVSRATKNIFASNYNEGFNSVIISKDGMVRASSAESLIGSFVYKDKKWLEQITSQDSGYVEVNDMGVNKLVAFYKLPDLDFYALECVNIEHLLEPVRSIERLGWIVMFIAVLGACFVIYIIAMPVVRDLLSLASYADKVGAGQLDEKLNIERNDEIGVVSVAFSSMVVQLKNMIYMAEAATRAKSDFLARMSHEIRTPMNAILGMTYIALQNNPNLTQRNSLLKIQTAAQNLLGIINDILDFSKIEANKMELELTTFSLSGMLKSIYDLLDLKASDKKIDLVFSLDEKVPDIVVGDSLRLSQVCINLCNNAIKFTENGSVTLHVIQVKEENQKVTLQFSVSDTGIGMQADSLEHIFEAFTQEDGSTTRRFGGTGLGLAISKLLVELMHGKIWVDSTVGVGSTFYFTVILEFKENAEPLEQVKVCTDESECILIEQARILLVEDNEVNQEIASELLHGLINIYPDVANNGAEAVELCREKEFDLVLMDIQMPIMDGLEATQNIRALEVPWAKKMPIIAMTANAMSGDRDKSLLAGMNNHITKPINVSELQSVLMTWLLKAK
ncbi:ATP-binding protein [Desulfovibrio litoralis]|nr:ATP-binding protein [Desulfovibrio litoralis]